MHYYKILNNREIIGICNSTDLRTWQSKHNIMLCCDENKAEYIYFENQYYHDGWMKNPKNSDIKYITCEISEIQKEEYNILIKAYRNGEEYPEYGDTEEQNIGTIEIDVDEQHTLDYVMQRKINEINKACNVAIEGGFDLLLEDNVLHHFSLTTQDQLNLITLSTQLSNGMTSIPYHADGELCRFFSANEVNMLLTKATEHKTYHVTYCNGLKKYVQTLSNIKDISDVYYGMELPPEF